MLTEREFVEAFLAEPAASQFEATAQTTPPQSTSAVGLSPRMQSKRGPFVVKKLRIGRGVAVMNSQILRSAAFCKPELGAPYPALSHLRGYEISVTEMTLTQDHLDLLLFAVSRVRYEPRAKHRSRLLS